MNTKIAKGERNWKLLKTKFSNNFLCRAASYLIQRYENSSTRAFFPFNNLFLIRIEAEITYL